MAKYPRIVATGRGPTAKKHFNDLGWGVNDGKKSHGKPCICCGIGTVGYMWIQINYFRGDDVPVRVCAKDWKKPKEEIIAAWEASFEQETQDDTIQS